MKNSLSLSGMLNALKFLVMIAVLTLVLPTLSVMIGFASAGSSPGSAVIAGSNPVYVPDTGYFDISKQSAYSDFVWNEQGFIEVFPEAYEHEFLVRNTGFARFAGHWSSNLPQRYLDVEDVTNRSENTYDEFVIGSDNGEGTLPGEMYWIFLDLSNQDSAVATSRTTLEAEHNVDAPWPHQNAPVPSGYFDIRNFRAPRTGTWNLTASSASSAATVAVREDLGRDESIGEFMLERANMLKNLAAESPEKKMRAIISFKDFTSFAETQAFLDKNKLKAEEVWYEAPGYQFGGGFNLTGSVAASVDRVITNLEENIVHARQRLAITTEMRERSGLRRLINKQQMMIKTIRGGAVMLYGLEVEAELKDLSSLLKNPLISLVDPDHLPVTPGGVRALQRPIHPAEAMELETSK